MQIQCWTPEPPKYPIIASVQWDARRLFYVADRPRSIVAPNGRHMRKPGYADWEYTEGYQGDEAEVD